jgi:hypothetical protein
MDADATLREILEELRDIRAGTKPIESLDAVITSLDAILEWEDNEESPREVKPAPEPPPPDEQDAKGR